MIPALTVLCSTFRSELAPASVWKPGSAEVPAWHQEKLTVLQLREYSSGLTTLSWYSILQMMMTHTQTVDRQDAMGLKRQKGVASDHSTTRTRFITDAFRQTTQTHVPNTHILEPLTGRERTSQV